ncbi:hypothetical protein [Algoriphagus halophilus]|uniref:MetA-pathway of phenol degradation n=1 Tax=Algoriphagus halophilus TaxID=226505 RepID=A0A1N6DR15_9BACT|nr:hypothetical protein [Algoriphagus halophilus]SIN73216.1 hypothetical protein SAMN05444394_1285 [Algoriphagus halophilus]
MEKVAKRYERAILLKFLYILVVLIVGFVVQTKAQQFNTDNYLSMPHGTGTFVLTAGQRNSNFVSSFGLAPGFEFFFQANLFRDYRIDDYVQHFTTSIYGKYMFWVNKEKTGGAAAFFGFGRSPGYYEGTEFTELHKNVWTSIPVTIPLFQNMLSWDIMPGAIVDFDTKNKDEVTWGFTWSSRLAIYKIIPQTAIVAEVYGTEGSANSPAEYKVGLRWEPNDFIVPAITYSSQFQGKYGAGIEIGVMIFSPQFLKKDYIKNNRIQY